MPRVIFWNVARAGGKEGPLATDMLCEDLAGLADTHNPDLIILCECIRGFSNHSRACPAGYSLVKPSNPRLYAKPSMLRYALLRRNDLQCQSRLLKTTTSKKRNLRPALGITIPGFANLVALHAASISNSLSVQIGQLISAHERLIRSDSRHADMLIGDFNVDINEPGNPATVRGRLSGSDLAGYQPRGPRGATHRKGKTLDWTLLRPGLNASVRLITRDEEPQGREYKNKFLNQKESDHWPILASW